MTGRHPHTLAARLGSLAGIALARMRKSPEVRCRAAWKFRVNIPHLLPACQAPTVWIDPKKLSLELSSKSATLKTPNGAERIVPKDHTFYWGKWIDGFIPADDHVSAVFVRETIQGIPLDKTRLWTKEIREGGKTHRRFLEGKRRRLETIEDLERYRRHVVKLVESVERRGIVAREEFWKTGDPPKEDTDIGIAVARDRIFFFRKGHHRLAVAKELGVERVPCTIHLMDFALLENDASLPGEFANDEFAKLRSYLQDLLYE